MDEGTHATGFTRHGAAPEDLLSPGPSLLEQRELLTFTPVLHADHVGELVGVVQRLSMARSLAEVQEIVRSSARRLTGADGATFIVRDGSDCYYADEDAISPLWKGNRFPMETCVSGWSMMHKQSVAIEDIYLDDRVPHEAYRPTFVQSLAIVPIRQLDPLGAIGNYWATPHKPSEHELQLLQALADSTAVALENIRIYQTLEEARFETLQRLALAAEYRDDDTYEHTERVAFMADLIAAEMQLPARWRTLLRQAAPLHDIGKLAISDTILLKPGRLTNDEFETIKTHTSAGAAILAGSKSDVLRLAQEIALTHHEWWDGNGYPARLGGETIPISGRIVALADVFDALTHARPYKEAWPVQRALAKITELTGRQFDPAVVSAFMALDTDAVLAV